MSKNKKPIFTPEELNLVKTSLDIGYEPNALLPGYDFKKKHFQRKIPNLFIDIKEKLDGTAKKREYHKEINHFCWAYIQQNKLMFGVKFSSHGFNKIKDLEKSVIHKYKQLLKYYLEKAGWQNVTADNSGDYFVPLDSQANIELLYSLSPSIGFYHNTKRPTIATLEKLSSEIKTKQEQLWQSKNVANKRNNSR